MIGKTSIGRSFKGCCAYNMEKVEKGKGEVLISQGVRDYDRAAMVADFVGQAQMNPALSRSVWHTAISFSPGDESRLQADPQLMQKVATDYLKGMGLDQSQYIVIRHRDTEHSHFHIIANRVDKNGATISDSHNFKRSEKLLRQIEQRYDLTPFAEQSQRKSLEKVPELDHTRIEMRDQVRACLKESATGQELRQALDRHSIRIKVNRTGDNVPRGLTFSKISQDERGEELAVRFKGSQLHKDLSYAGVEQQIQRNYELRQKSAQERERTQANERKEQERVLQVQKQATEAAKERDRVISQQAEKSPQIEEKQLKHGTSRKM